MSIIAGSGVDGNGTATATVVVIGVIADSCGGRSGSVVIVSQCNIFN